MNVLPSIFIFVQFMDDYEGVGNRVSSSRSWTSVSFSTTPVSLDSQNRQVIGDSDAKHRDKTTTSRINQDPR
jgi:hypothetical protein